MLRPRTLFAVGLCCFLLLSNAIQASPTSFANAKKIAKRLFADHKQTLYCQCRFDNQNQVNLSSCGMKKAADIKRARQIEWEHMMPASQFGSALRCWQEKLCVHSKTGKAYGGRKCCRKINPDFRRAEAELYNLWPAVGLVNQYRANYQYGLLSRRSNLYGCAFKVDSSRKTVEPIKSVKGLVARANLFMAMRYHIVLDKAYRDRMEEWNALYPPDEVERAWAQKVAREEGYRNPYIPER